jgi:hypothetical protein
MGGCRLQYTSARWMERTGNGTARLQLPPVPRNPILPLAKQRFLRVRKRAPNGTLVAVLALVDYPRVTLLPIPPLFIFDPNSICLNFSLVQGAQPAAIGSDRVNYSGGYSCQRACS